MAIPFEDLLADMTEEERAAIRAESARLIAMEYCRRKIRQARKDAKAEIGDSLKADEAAVSRLEARADLYLETLRKRIEAVGGKLTLVAEFPDGTSARIDRLRGLKGRVSKPKAAPVPVVEAAKPADR